MSKPVAFPSVAEAHASDRQFVTALARGLDILRCFDRPGAELSVSELARRVGLNQPTTWRLCHTLVACGYLVRSQNGTTLRVGAPALTLGYAAIRGMSFPALALPYMRQLCDRTKATITLSLLQGTEMVSVEACLGDFVMPNQPVGWRSLLTTVPSGLAVLAAMPDAVRKKLLDQIANADRKAWPRRAQRVDRACADYQRDGFVIVDAMLDAQYAAVAVPIMAEQHNEPVAWALSYGGLATRWDKSHLREAGGELLRLHNLLQPALLHAA
jgi:DNA-binding IclR family transcriptional regulator